MYSYRKIPLRSTECTARFILPYRCSIYSILNSSWELWIGLYFLHNIGNFSRKEIRFYTTYVVFTLAEILFLLKVSCFVFEIEVFRKIWPFCLCSYKKKLRKQTPSTLTLINTFVVVVVAVAVLLVLVLVLHTVPALASVPAYLEYQKT